MMMMQDDIAEWLKWVRRTVECVGIQLLAFVELAYSC